MFVIYFNLVKIHFGQFSLLNDPSHIIRISKPTLTNSMIIIITPGKYGYQYCHSHSHGQEHPSLPPQRSIVPSHTVFVRGVYLGQRVTTGSRHFVQNVERKEEKTCLLNPCNVQDLGVFMYMLDGQTL